MLKKSTKSSKIVQKTSSIQMFYKNYHFLQQYGEIADYEVDSSLPSITLNYKTRKEAEMALLKGKNFQVRLIHRRILFHQ